MRSVGQFSCSFRDQEEAQLAVEGKTDASASAAACARGDADPNAGDNAVGRKGKAGESDGDGDHEGRLGAKGRDGASGARSEKTTKPGKYDRRAKVMGRMQKLARRRKMVGSPAVGRGTGGRRRGRNLM